MVKKQDFDDIRLVLSSQLGPAPPCGAFTMITTDGHLRLPVSLSRSVDT